MDFLRTQDEVEHGDADYCRSIEAYLCRKNDGHLIRIVGPAFDRVCAWADTGVPLKVAYRGIDRYFERYYAKGPRRRPVRIEFCEADVLDVFDDWRRAVGVLVARERPGDDDAEGAGATAGVTPDEDAPLRSRRSLSAHLDRAIAKLAALRPPTASAWDLQSVVSELDALRDRARTIRGAARQDALDRLRDLDAAMIAHAWAQLDEATRDEIRREAEGELAPFRERMPADAYTRSMAACMDRIVRERARLPVLGME